MEQWSLALLLQLERARIASETLDALGLPALVLNERGKVLAANPLIEALNGCVQWLALDRVSLKDRAADQLLRDAIASIDVAGCTTVRSFPVRDTGADTMMVAHVVPIRLSARDIFVRCAAVLVLTPVTLPRAPPVELVQSLFDLTPAEAHVARSLSAGETVETIASLGGVSLNTVRTQLRCVLEKTGCHRQAEVVALLSSRFRTVHRGAPIKPCLSISDFRSTFKHRSQPTNQISYRASPILMSIILADRMETAPSER
jgi:DNA-binding CsgD family transcriptional regulator